MDGGRGAGTSGDIQIYPEPESGPLWGCARCVMRPPAAAGASRGDFPPTGSATRRERSARHETEEQQHRDVFMGREV
jgi:hypothetical protein